MGGHRGTESDFEVTTIVRLEKQGYTWCHGSEVEREGDDEVVLRSRLRRSLTGRYPDLPAGPLDEAVTKLSRPEGVDPLRRNFAFHKLLTRGFEVRIEHAGGRVEHRHIYAIDWENPEANEFLVVNQLPVRGKNDRRPDIMIYVNGLPLVLFELKNPYSDAPTVDEALNQIQHYIHDIPQVFEFNSITVVSDGVHTLHGVWTANEEWYAPWKSIDGRKVEPDTTGSMKILIEGLFPKDRLLSYMRDFIAFEEANEKLTKKGAKYHQYFAVRLAARKGATDRSRRERQAPRRHLAYDWLGQVTLDGLPGGHPAPDARAGESDIPGPGGPQRSRRSAA